MVGWLRGAVGIGQWVQVCCQRIVWSVFCLSVCVCVPIHTVVRSQWVFLLDDTSDSRLLRWLGEERKGHTVAWCQSGWHQVGNWLVCLGWTVWFLVGLVVHVGTVSQDAGMLLVVVCAVLNAGAGASSTVCWCFATTWLYNERTIGAVLEHELA